MRVRAKVRVRSRKDCVSRIFSMIEIFFGVSIKVAITLKRMCRQCLLVHRSGSFAVVEHCCVYAPVWALLPPVFPSRRLIRIMLGNQDEITKPGRC